MYPRQVYPFGRLDLRWWAGSESLRLSRAMLARYRVSPLASDARVAAYGIVVQLRARDRSDDLCGVGEVAVAPPHLTETWEALRQCVEQLLDSRLSPAIDEGRMHVGQGWPLPQEIERPPGAVGLAIEMALLDLYGKWGLHDLWKPRDGKTVEPVCWGGTYSLPIAESSLDDQLADIDGHGTNSWAVRLRSTGDPELDLGFIRQLSHIGRRADRIVPIWLECGAEFTQDTAESLVERAAVELAPGRMLLVEDPLPLTQSASLPRVQQAASRRRGGDVRVVAGKSIDGKAGLDVLLQYGRIGGIHIAMEHWGSLIGAHAAAVAAKRAQPDMLVLVDNLQGSGLSSSAMECMLSRTPEVDVYGADNASLRWPRLILEQDDYGGGAAGFRREVDFTELAAVIDHVQLLPAGASSNKGVNRFSESRLVGTGEIDSPTLLEAEALKAGLRIRRASDVRSSRRSMRFFVAEDETGRAVGFSGALCSTGGPGAVKVADRKSIAREVLRERDLPVAEGQYVKASNRDEAYRAAEHIGFPLVVKPVAGSKGRGVTTNINTAEEFSAAVEAASSIRSGSYGILVERFVEGSDYRILATRNRVLSVVRRSPASVTGDGRSTVIELVLEKNSVRRRNPCLHELPVVPREEAARLLSAQGLGPESVPAKGRQVALESVPNLSRGGESHEVLEATDATILELATSTVAAIPGLPYAGIDLIMADHEKDVCEQEVAIIEVNANPMLTMHHFPLFGQPRDVSGELLKEVAASSGLHTRTNSEPFTVELSVSGMLKGVGYRRWVAEAAKELGLSGWVGHSSLPDCARILARGPALNLVLLLRMAFEGPSRADVLSIVASVVSEVPGTEFAVRE